MECETVSSLLACKDREFIQAPLTVEVLLLEEFIMVPGAALCRCRCVFADSTGVVRGFCYKPPDFEEGDTVTLYNYNVEDKRIIFHKDSTSEGEEQAMDLPASFLEDAQEIMHSPVTEPINIRDIQEVSPTEKVTFSGVIKEIDGPMELMTDHGARDLKELICTDGTGRVYLGLWEYCSDMDFDVGEKILVKDARTRDNTYHQEITVSINHPDEIEVLA